ncbi:MAG TPA: DUF4405 domain-containing protein [Longimicrobiales bacterium]|nr:DUF4405 domain-containing protein [Longimicrobiales bacterium]
MRKQTLNFSLDTLSFLAMLMLLGTGLLMKFTLPPGSGGKTLWGLGRHGWGDLHFWIAITLAALITLHVALHWAWVYASSRRLAGGAPPRMRRPGRERAFGYALLGAVVLAVVGFLAAARGSVVGGGADDHAPAPAAAIAPRAPEAGSGH